MTFKITSCQLTTGPFYRRTKLVRGTNILARPILSNLLRYTLDSPSNVRQNNPQSFLTFFKNLLPSLFFSLSLLFSSDWPSIFIHTMLRLENYFSRLIRFLDILLSFLLFLFFFCSTNDQTFERNNVQISTSAHFTLERILYYNSPTHSPLFVHSRRAYYISRCSNELFSRIELNDSGNVTSRKASTNLVTPSIRKNCLRATCPSPSFLSFLLFLTFLSPFLSSPFFKPRYVRR